MEPADESAFSWISESDDSAADFPRSVRVLHLMLEDLSVENHRVTWDQWERETGERDAWLERLKGTGETGETLASALANSKAVGGIPSSTFPARRILWRELAEREGLAWEDIANAEAIWRVFRGGTPRYVVGADVEGRIDAVSAGGIVRAIQAISSPQPCFFHFFGGTGGDWQSPFVVRGQLDEVQSHTWPRAKQSPDYWWPPDRSWLVHTDYDSTVTTVSGAASLAEAVEADSELETLRLR